jgi:DNA helicase-2/ATP-dependent DNA helicase PcrA
MNLDDKLYSANFVYNRISAAKNNLISWQEYAKNEQIQADDNSSGRPFFR